MPYKLNKLFRSNESKFCLTSALYFAAIPLVSFLLTSYVVWIFTNMAQAFFESSGYPEMQPLKETFFNYITQDIFEVLPYLCIFLVILFFVGYYIAKLLLRPFDNVERYINTSIAHPENEVKSRSAYGLEPLDSFSFLFFKYVQNYRTGKSNEDFKLPEKYNRLNTPYLDFNFIAFFFFFVLFFSAINLLLIYMLTTDIHSNIIQLAIETLKHRRHLALFFLPLEDILFSSYILSLIIMLVLYAIFLYTRFLRVTGPAFAFFRSMKSFMLGEEHTISLRNQDPVHRQADKLNHFLNAIKKEK